ncbi:hypothetical protein K503DRAFT_870449 [Rhizopogon vinicolor AM-OR11-026]|uniref:Uncharacterized protein n=1 Tax=Rhizopogon vinicolor AM-OR11-026 TaxID=1314800 RepID=A0A1B7MGY5_9AGAM|nr:hypothetical protein K503DRAFT_870449 [Rhizopogon vinicolor AM-OR11-026]
MGRRRGKLTASTDPEYKTKVFDSLTSYKCKDDFVTIAGTLSLPRDGTVIELTARIKEHLAVNTDCTNQPRFAALLGNKRSSRVMGLMAPTACTSSHPQNLLSELSTSSHLLGYLPPPHFMHPSSHIGLNIPPSNPPYFSFSTTWHTSRTTQSTHVSIPTSTYIPSTIFYSAVIISAFVVI